MKNLTLIRFTALAFFAVFSAAEFNPTKIQYCFEGCMEALAEQTYVGTPTAEDGYYLETCENALHVQSIFLCVRAYCTSEEARQGFEFESSNCKKNGASLPSMSIVDNVTMEDIQSMQTLDYGVTLEMINSTIIPSRDHYQLGLRTISWWYEGKDAHLWYSKAIFIFWGSIVAIGICVRLLLYMRTSMFVPRSMTEEDRTVSRHTKTVERFWNQVRARLLLPAVFGKHCRDPRWYGTLPPRAESTVICMQIILNVILCAVSYSAFPRNLYWDGKSSQIWRLVADRTGYLSYANLAVFFAFGIRNNILIWLTGWNFATFNRFHRWTARVATLEAILHSVGYTVFTFISTEDGFEAYKESWAERYWWTGVVATILMSLLLVFSILWLRVKCYDLFLIMHIALALVILVCLFYHTKIFLGEFDGFLWPCVAFWAFDRVCRIARVLAFLIKTKMTKISVGYSKEDEIIRIDVTNIFFELKWTASGGTHFFLLYSPLARLGWQSHPFTLVRWIAAEQDHSDSVSPISEHSLEEKSSAREDIRQVLKTPEGSTRYSFLVRPMSGYTGRLRRSLKSQTDPTPVIFLFEGPYGHVPSFKRFTDVLLVIGGSGISVGISHIYSALEQNPEAKLRLTWTCRRSSSYMDSVMEKELKSALETGRLAIDAFVTGAVRDIKGVACKDVTHGRPNVAAVIHEAAIERRASLAVVVCGPASLADDARAAFVAELRDRQDDMELFMEAFNW